MPLTQFERNLLLARGLNPDNYAPIEAVPPQVEKPKSTATQAFMHAGKRSIVPTAGAVLGTAAALAAAPATLGQSLWAIPIGLGSAYLGSTVGSAVQDVVIKHLDGEQKYAADQAALAEERKEHPVASLLGELAPQLAVARPALQGLKDLARLPMRATVETDPGRKALISGISSAVNTGVGVAAEGYNQYKEGELDPTRLAIAGAAGGLLTHPWGVGKMLSGHVSPEQDAAAVEGLRTESTDAPRTTETAHGTLDDSTKIIELGLQETKRTAKHEAALREAARADALRIANEETAEAAAQEAQAAKAAAAQEAAAAKAQAADNALLGEQMGQAREEHARLKARNDLLAAQIEQRKLAAEQRRAEQLQQAAEDAERAQIAEATAKQSAVPQPEPPRIPVNRQLPETSTAPRKVAPYAAGTIEPSHQEVQEVNTALAKRQQAEELARLEASAKRKQERAVLQQQVDEDNYQNIFKQAFDNSNWNEARRVAGENFDNWMTRRLAELQEGRQKLSRAVRDRGEQGTRNMSGDDVPEYNEKYIRWRELMIEGKREEARAVAENKDIDDAFLRELSAEKAHLSEEHEAMVEEVLQRLGVDKVKWEPTSSEGHATRGQFRAEEPTTVRVHPGVQSDPMRAIAAMHEGLHSWNLRILKEGGKDAKFLRNAVRLLTGKEWNGTYDDPALAHTEEILIEAATGRADPKQFAGAGELKAWWSALKAHMRGLKTPEDVHASYKYRTRFGAEAHDRLRSAFVPLTEETDDVTREMPFLAGQRGEMVRKWTAGDENNPNVGRHYGDGGIAQDTIGSRHDAGRGTGHYGTGVYFLGSPAVGTHSTRPLYAVDVTRAKLAKMQTTQDAYLLHDGLKEFNNTIYNGGELRFDEPRFAGAKAQSKISLALGVHKHSYEQVAEAMRNVQMLFNNGKADKLRTPSTYLMQKLGYDGIDVRGTEADNTMYGSVLYPYKGEVQDSKPKQISGTTHARKDATVVNAHPRSMSTNPLEGAVDAVRRVSPETAEAFDQYYDKHAANLGKYVSGPLHKLKPLLGDIGIRGVSERLNAIRTYMNDKYEGRTPSVHLDARAQHVMNSVIKPYMRMVRTEQNARAPIMRTGMYDEWYFPRTVSREVLRTFEGEDRAAKDALRTEYLQYKIRNGSTPPEAEAAFNEILGGFAKKGAIERASNYGPLDKAAGEGIPDSWMERNALSSLAYYGERVASRFAFADAVQKNKTVTAALADPLVRNNRNVQHVLDDIHGVRDRAEAKREAALSLVKALLLGPGTGTVDILSTPFNAMKYLTPSGLLRGSASALRDWSKNWKDSFAKGANRLSVGQFDANLGMLSDRITAARDIINVAQGRDVMEKTARTWAFGVGRDNAALALAGKDKKFLNQFGKEFIGKPATQEAIDTMARRFVEAVQGSFDPRNLPHWATRGSLAPFVGLMRWNIEMANRFNKDVIKSGDPYKMVMAAFATVAGGAVVTSVREELTGNKNKAPTFKELQEMPDDQALPYAYKLLSLASAVGTAGMYADVLKVPLDYLYGNKPQAATNPLVEAMGNVMNDIGNAVQAAHDGATPDEFIEGLFEAGQKYVQAVRIATNVAAEAGLAPEVAERKARGNEMRDVRVWKQLHGMPTPRAGDFNVNPFENRDERRFKQTADPKEAMALLRDNIIPKIMALPPELRRQRLDSLSANSVQSMPANPYLARQYRDWKLRTEGIDPLPKALRQRALNSAKAQALP